MPNAAAAKGGHLLCMKKRGKEGERGRKRERERKKEAGGKKREREREVGGKERERLQPSAAHYAKVVPGFISQLQFMDGCVKKCV